MGTSTNYNAPPSWSPLKSEVTRAARGGPLTAAKAGDIVRGLIQHNGGVGAMARGQGGGGSVGGGGAARVAAQRLAAIVASVGTVGLAETLRREGLGDFVGRPMAEVLAAILEHVAGAASTIDEVDARAALARLQEELFDEVDDVAAVERVLAQQAVELDTLLSRYFGFYLFELFCRVFYERLIKVIGDAQASVFLGQIEDYISAALADRTSNRNVSSIDWPGQEGRQLSADIMEDTLNVFSQGA